MVWNYDGSNGDHNHDSSRVHLDILRDPRYFHFSNEFGVAFPDDGGVSFPKLTDFKFNQDKYQKALTFLKKSQTIDPRKRLSQSQLERLYPSDQPPVFRRLEQEAALAVKRLDAKLKDLQTMG